MLQAILHLAGVAASLLLSFVSSGMETALYRASRVRLRIASDQGEKRASLVLRTLEKLDAMVTTILINNNIAAYAGAYFVTTQLVLWAVPHSEIITTALVTPTFFVLTESLPKQLAYNRANAFSLAFIRVFSVFRVLLSPMVWALNRASGGLRRLLGAPGEANLSQSQRSLLLEHLNNGVAENVLTEEQNRMAVRIMHLESISAGDGMLPLSRLPRIPATATRDRAVREMARRRSRIVLLTDAAGVPTGEAVTMDALIMRPASPDSPAAAASEKLERIRAETAIPDVLNLFRTRHARNCLVVERGRAVGLITTQTVLDRIAGIVR